MNASEQIDEQIKSVGGWCGELMITLRKLIHETDPEIEEQWKWGTGVYVHNGMVCAIGAFKDHVKLNFFKGALIKDPQKLFNNGLESKNSRSIDFFEGDKINETEVESLLKQAVVLNKHE